MDTNPTRKTGKKLAEFTFHNFHFLSSRHRRGHNYFKPAIESHKFRFAIFFSICTATIFDFAPDQSYSACQNEL
jgi:hypothetical protein